MPIRAWGLSDVGKVRQVNEDAILVDQSLGAYAVADGMGGQGAGDQASRLALEIVANHLRSHQDILERATRDRETAVEMLPTLVEAAFQSASTRVYNQASARALPTGRNMATTLSLLLVDGPRGVIGHVGDSRIYLLRDGQLYLITEDHNHLQLLIKNGLDPKSASEVPHAHALTRALGAQARVEVDTLSFVPLPGDVFLLCTDGLHKLVSREEIATLLADPDMDSVAARLIDLALERGGSDNVSVVVVQVDSDAEHTSTVHRDAKLEMEALGSLELFGNLDYLEILELMEHFEERHAAGGEVIFQEGSIGSELYVIVDGSVEIRVKGRLLRILEKGSHFGEFALIDQQPRSATIRTREPTHLLVLTQEQFERLKKENPSKALAFYEVIAKRLSLNLREADFLLLQRHGPRK